MKSKVVARARLICGIFIFIAILILVRLYFIQVVYGGNFRQEANGEYVEPGDTEDRDSIFFTTKDGQLVAAAVTETGYSIAINPSEVTNPSKVYEQLNAITPIDETTFMQDAAQTNETYEVVATHVSDEDADQIISLQIPGVIPATEEWRDYPGGDLAAQVIGFVGYQGNSEEPVGVYGLEKEYNSTLAEPSSSLFVNPFAEIFTNLESTVSKNPGAQQGSIVTSIEPNVQQELQNELAVVLKEYTPQFVGGIIMDPSTGEIIAMAQIPTFDPNDYSAATDPSVYTNRMVSGRYELGSIMKPLTMSAGLDSGAIEPDSTYDDTGCIKVSGDTICNYDLVARGPNTPMQTILSESLNVGASWVATQTGYPTFTKYIKSYFPGVSGIDLPDEVAPDLSTLDDGSGPAVNFDTASFGQGVAESPIEMIRALSAIPNGGYLPDPHIVTEIKYDDGTTKTISITEGPRVFSTTTASEVNAMLRNVYDYAEGNGIYYMPHYTAGAKTGTAQIPAPGGGYLPDGIDGVELHSFFGYVPASGDTRFIVFLFAYEPHGVEYASDTLGPTYYQIEQYLINYYNIPPDR